MKYDVAGKLHLTIPVFQAPMAGTATPALAAAVSNAGGLGLGVFTVAQAAALIEATCAMSSRPFNVNLFCHKPGVCSNDQAQDWINQTAPLLHKLGAKPPEGLQEIFHSFLGDDAMLRMLIEKRPRVISFHFGLPEPQRLAALRETGALLVATATSLAEAGQIAQAGLDAVIAQGWAAGGHRGIFDPDGPDDRLDTETLTRLLCHKGSLPVVAAGGIMDGADVRQALDWGAVAAQMGTAFISCPESAADDLYRACLNAASTTLMTRAISGRPARFIVNEAITFAAGLPQHKVPPFPFAYDMGDALAEAARAAQDTRFTAHLAGDGVARSRHVSAQDLMAEIATALKA